jgi:serine protease AprX
MNHRSLLLALSAITFVFTTPSAAADRHHALKMDRAVLASLGDGERHQRVIITLAPGCAAPVREWLEHRHNVVAAEHRLINAISARVRNHDLRRLAQSDCVQSIASDAIVHSSSLQASSGTALALASNGVPTVTSTLRDTLGLPHYASLDASVPTGAGGIGVAVIDSGIASSADFIGRITNFYDFTRDGISTRPYDDFGHGTHVAGLIGSSGKLSNYEFQGVAPSVFLSGLKVLDSTGAGRTSDVIKAIEFVVANRTKLNVQVVNVSLGHPIYAPAADDPLVQAVEKASAAGLVMVVAAGNFGLNDSSDTPGYAGITSPGNAPSAVTVGAADTANTVTRLDDHVAPYSSRGPSWFDGFEKPDVVAPGSRLAADTNVGSYLYTQLSGNRAQSDNGQQLLVLSGSSMATAVTSGVVALVMQAHNQNVYHRQKPLTPNLVKAILQYSAIPVGSADYLTQGAGQINAAGAVALGTAIDTSSPVGSPWTYSTVPAYSVVDGQPYPWSQLVIYGDTVLTGDPIYSNNVVWSTNVVWGTMSDDNVVWGTNTTVLATNVVWGTSAVWGANVVWSNLVVGQRVDGSNVVWSTQVVWGTNVVWSTLSDDNVVWGTMVDDDNVVWGTAIVKK